jgi:hypothetical protein
MNYIIASEGLRVLEEKGLIKISNSIFKNNANSKIGSSIIL